VFTRVERGERLIVTRDTHPVAELRPQPARSAGPAELPVSMGNLRTELATVNPLVDRGQRKPRAN
jgi:antitoxin (DNA-binding transcriptional repressor) of toxin-antitoxin stability system